MNAFLDWMEKRIPMMRVANQHAIQYPAPKNMTFWYVFGFLATMILDSVLIRYAHHRDALFHPI